LLGIKQSKAAAAAAAAPPTCCCGIDARSPAQCVSAFRAVRHWGKVLNGCSGFNDEQEVFAVGNTSWEPDRSKFQCRAGEGCAADTMMCMHQHGGHFMSQARAASLLPLSAQRKHWCVSPGMSVN